MILKNQFCIFINMGRYLFTILFTSIVILTSCIDDHYKPTVITPKVVLIVMDGARYSETWGDSTHQFIPFLSDSIAPKGAVFTNFKNQGITSTIPGHTALITGRYDTLANNGTEYPKHPSIFQYFEQKYLEKGWIISSKDKLSVLSNCNDSLWQNQHNPYFDCGKEGLGTGYGYREDSVTLKKALWILDVFKPRLCLINFKEPDASGHSGNWKNYLRAIQTTDSLIYVICKHIDQDPFYKDQTTVFITNDHGRHLDGIQDGFKSHGDTCSGCRHCMLFTYGPGIKKGIRMDTLYSFIDVTTTLASILKLKMIDIEGQVIKEGFSNQ